MVLRGVTLARGLMIIEKGGVLKVAGSGFFLGFGFGGRRTMGAMLSRMGSVWRKWQEDSRARQPPFPLRAAGATWETAAEAPWLSRCPPTLNGPRLRLLAPCRSPPRPPYSPQYTSHQEHLHRRLGGLPVGRPSHASRIQRLGGEKWINTASRPAISARIDKICSMRLLRAASICSQSIRWPSSSGSHLRSRLNSART